MSEERLMILTMVHEGKITPEQGEGLLKALPPDSAAESAQRDVTGGPVSTPPYQSLSDLQGRVADVQIKLGELQSKLGAATLPAKGVTLPFGLGEMNVGQIIDEAVRGVNSVKAESIKTFKLAARTAQKEGRKLRKEANKTGKSFGIDLNISFGRDGRPRNSTGAPELIVTDEVALNVDEGQTLYVVSRLGDVKVSSSTVTVPHMRFHLTAWSTDTETLERLGQLRPVVTLDPAGKLSKILVDAAPADLYNLTMDLELIVPDTLIPHLETSFGNVSCEGRSNGAGSIQTQSGHVKLQSIRGDGSVNSSILTRTGNIALTQWDGPLCTAETVSGHISSDGISGSAGAFRSLSGTIVLRSLQIGEGLAVESSSGDVRVTGANVGQAFSAKTQSGDVSVIKLIASSIDIGSVSGDLLLDSAQCVDGSICAETVSGDIDVMVAASTKLKAVTVSGDIDLVAKVSFQGSLVASSIGGDIAATLPSASDVHVELSSQTGAIETLLPLNGQVLNGNRFLSGTLGTGQGSVNLQSVSGGVAIKPFV